MRGPEQGQGLGVWVWLLLLLTSCVPLEAGAISSPGLVSASVKWEWFKREVLKLCLVSRKIVFLDKYASLD